MTDKKTGKFQAYLKRKGVEVSVQAYLISAMGAMAQGLFASLLIGTIFNTLGQVTGLAIFNTIGGFATQKYVVGAAMAMSIGYALKAAPLVLFSLAAVGAAANELGSAGGPLAVYAVALIACEAGKLVSKETKVDILVTPAVTLGVGVLVALGIAPPIGTAANYIGVFIMRTTELAPFFMGIIVSVVMGIVLTLPISSAAICAAFGLVGLAGGAAVAGCCAHMVGFAVMTWRDNKMGGLVAQGIGTSMLQVPNLVKNPWGWLPPVLASAVTGPIATCLFKLQMNGAPVSSGMGTSGLVGQLGVITGWLTPSEKALEMGAAAITPGAWEWIGLILISFVLPAVLTWLFALPLRKKGLIKDGDFKIEV